MIRKTDTRLGLGAAPPEARTLKSQKVLKLIKFESGAVFGRLITSSRVSLSVFSVSV